jgi:broad specificity phosphatase PhoE
MKKLLIALLIFSHICSAETTIYLVRHAEKVTTKDVKDPGLTAIGKFRALNIAKQLSEVGITKIFSTKYNRTMQTAQPLADFLDIQIEYYDPRQLTEFADKIKKMQGNFLIVGHSNTTPQLTQLLSSKDVKPIHEGEYDNLYQVIISENQTLLNRFKSIPSYDVKSTKSQPQLKINK